jgi:glycosyltransferase involved in cell wall biosynthesis
VSQPHIVYVVTSDVSADILLRGQLEYVRNSGFDVSLVSSGGSRLAAVSKREGVPSYVIDLEREVSPFKDVRALAQLTLLLRQIRPDIVNASTPKGALLGLLASALAGVPNRVYLLRGLRLETLSPAGQLGMQAIERLCSTLAHRILCVSSSLRAAYVARGLAPARRCQVLGAGSSNGIDCDRFTRNSETLSRAASVTRELGLDSAQPTLGFIGRPVRDKGIAQLCEVFRLVKQQCPRAQLLIVGADFAGDKECDEMVELRAMGGVHVVGATTDVAPYYALMNVLVFPSYREGFPNVVLEASCMGVPVVGFDATGVKDAIVDGQTGVVCPLYDAVALGQATLRYLTCPELAQAHGARGARRARAEFARERVWEELVSFYRELCPPGFGSVLTPKRGPGRSPARTSGARY